MMMRFFFTKACLVVILIGGLAAGCSLRAGNDVVEPTAVGATDLEIARNTLLAFHKSLHDGLYTEAAPLYGGPLDAIIFSDPIDSSADPALIWEQACFVLRCMLVADIVHEEQLAADEFSFLVEFSQEDGTLFVLGPCCGASEEDMPPVWQFPYTVMVIDGRFVVMQPPQYVP